MTRDIYNRNCSSECPKLKGWMLRRARRLVELLEQDMPTQLIAGQMILLWQTAWVFCGRWFGDELAELMIGTTRRSHGFCQHCDNPIAPDRSHNPICETCDARLDEEIREATEERNVEERRRAIFREPK